MRYKRSFGRLLGGTAGLLAWLLAAAPALAGGWSVVTLDHAPENVRPGVPFEIGFTVRQHGQTPLSGLKPVVRLASRTGGKAQVEVAAHDAGATGHYVARITLPTAGEWAWAIEVFEGPHEMAPLQVGGLPAAAPDEAAPPASAAIPAVGIAALAVLAAGAGVGLARVRRAQAT